MRLNWKIGTLLVSLLGVGIVFGVLFQKFVGVGNLFREQPSSSGSEVSFEALEGRRVKCILTLGQSNSANHGQPRGRAGGPVFALHEGKLWQAHDPLPGGSGAGGSVWTRLGPMLLTDDGVDVVVFCSLGQGSTSVRAWMPGQAHFSRVEQAVTDCHDLGLAIDAVIWHQGETDAWEGKVDAATYAKSLGAVISGLRGLGVDAPIYICQATRDPEGVVNPAIRQAQASLWSADAKVYAGVDTDTLGDDCRSDGVHFNEKGLTRFAELLAEALSTPNTEMAPSRNP